MEYTVGDIHDRVSRWESPSVDLHDRDAISAQWWLRQPQTERQVELHSSMEFERPTSSGTELVVRGELPRQSSRTSVATTDSDELFGVRAWSKHRQHYPAKNSHVVESKRRQVLQPDRRSRRWRHEQLQRNAAHRSTPACTWFDDSRKLHVFTLHR